MKIEGNIYFLCLFSFLWYFSLFFKTCPTYTKTPPFECGFNRMDKSKNLLVAYDFSLLTTALTGFFYVLIALLLPLVMSRNKDGIWILSIFFIVYVTFFSIFYHIKINRAISGNE